LGFKPKVLVNPLCNITLVWDVLLNRETERMRGIHRHGSVGVGFGQTLERAEHSRFGFIGHTMFVNYRRWLETIAKEYYGDDGDLTQYMINEIELFKTRIEICDDPYTSKGYEVIIFEGAQGLLLDQYYGYFPHVTRSNCGLKNISKLLHRHKYAFIEVNYITRSYTTRHGPGPLKNEMHMPESVVDNTNIFNEWQGHLRYAPLDTDLFNMVTDKDFALFAPRRAKRINTVTCLDQIDVMPYINDVVYKSFGPTKDDIM